MSAKRARRNRKPESKQPNQDRILKVAAVYNQSKSKFNRMLKEFPRLVPDEDTAERRIEESLMAIECAILAARVELAALGIDPDSSPYVSNERGTGLVQPLVALRDLETMQESAFASLKKSREKGDSARAAFARMLRSVYDEDVANTANLDYRASNHAFDTFSPGRQNDKILNLDYAAGYALSKISLNVNRRLGAVLEKEKPGNASQALLDNLPGAVAENLPSVEAQKGFSDLHTNTAKTIENLYKEDLPPNRQKGDLIEDLAATDGEITENQALNPIVSIETLRSLISNVKNISPQNKEDLALFLEKPYLLEEADPQDEDTPTLAAEMGCSEVTARQRKSRLLRKLREASKLLPFLESAEN